VVRAAREILARPPWKLEPEDIVDRLYRSARMVRPDEGMAGLARPLEGGPETGSPPGEGVIREAERVLKLKFHRPGGKGRQLDASQYYQRLQGPSDPMKAEAEALMRLTGRRNQPPQGEQKG
jgi:hypothetical protein